MLEQESTMKRSASEEVQNEELATKRHRGTGRAADVRFLLQSKNAGAIIGKGGSNINRLRKDFKASVTVPDCPGPERILTVTADIDTVGDILMDIIPKLEDYAHYHSTNFQCEMRLLLHQSHAGCVIGRGGQRIKELREKTGAQIKVYTSCCPNSTERVAQITGLPDVVVNCIKEITDLISQAPIKGPSQLYDPHNYSVFYSVEYGGYGEGGGGRMRGNRGGGDRQMRGGQAPWRDDRINDFEPFLPPEHGRGLAQGPRPGNRSMGGPGMFGGYGRGGRQDRNQMGSQQMGNQGGGQDMWRPGGRDNNSYGAPRGGLHTSRGPLIGGPNPPIRNGGMMGDNNGADMGMHGGMDFDIKTEDATGGWVTSKTSAENRTQLNIAKDLAGAVIGKGGQRIRKIRRESGAEIIINEAKPGEQERVISIIGTPIQIQTAQALLEKSIREHSGRF